ncbi:DUF6572 domain-containing protein [Methylotuvimicrobium sp.]|uniref:DUF6572 domain-containing protein n=1 Tax=Methylotuvimicrobium sp. TaxID=2822413 RepID=UPI003D65545F
MSIEDAQVIDIISSAPDGNSVTLTVTDHLEWGNSEHLIKIQDKLNTYLSFMESGEIYNSYPKAKGKELKLEVVCKYEPDEEGKKLLALCEEVISNAGFSFEYRVHEI